MYPKNNKVKHSKLKVLDPHRNKQNQKRVKGGFFFFFLVEIAESKIFRLTLLVLDTVKHGMSRRWSVISIMVAHYKTVSQYFKA